MACSEEIGFAGICASGGQFLHRIIARNAVAIQRRPHLLMQKRGDVRELGVGVSESRHSFIGPTVFDRRTDQLAVLIAIHQRGSNQIGPAGAGGIVPMAKPASLLELLLAALHGFRIGRGRVGRQSKKGWEK